MGRPYRVAISRIAHLIITPSPPQVAITGIPFTGTIILASGRVTVAFRSQTLYKNRMKSTISQPSAWIPLVMSIAALADVLVYVALFGTARQADEGLAAHLWQLLMGAQLPIVAWFALTWLPQTPRKALLVLALQGLAILAAMAPVFLLHF